MQAKLISVITIFFSLSLANPSALHLLRRQTTINNCIAGPCSWIGAGALCPSIACECVYLATAGPALVQQCITCVQPFNATLASGLATLASDCAALATLTATPNATNFVATATGNGTLMGGPTLNPTCAGNCSVARNAEKTCLNYNCACPTVLSAGAICSQCYLAINASQATLWGSDIAFCRSWSATAMPNTTIPTRCTGVCNSIASVTTCANLDCSCPAILSAGSACSQCLGSFNLTKSGLGPAITSCRAWSATFQKPTITPTPAPSVSGTVQVTVGSTSTTSDGNNFVPFEWMYLTIVLGFVAGLFSFLM